MGAVNEFHRFVVKSTQSPGDSVGQAGDIARVVGPGTNLNQVFSKLVFQETAFQFVQRGAAGGA